MKQAILWLMLLTVTIQLQSTDTVNNEKLKLIPHYKVPQNGTWTFQQALTQNNTGSDEGFSVSLSADGNTLAAGANLFNSEAGQTQIYSRSGTQWSHQASLSQNIPGAGEGGAVALSSDGNTLAAGSWLWKGAGATQIYTRQQNSPWVYQKTLSRGISGSKEGCSVALSSDGNTFAAGAFQLNSSEGGTQIYIRLNNVWTYQTTVSQGTSGTYEGHAVALSSDGSTLAAWSYGPGNASGGIQIYIRSGETWVYQATLSQELANSMEGYSLSLSADGNTLAAGSPGLNNAGATQIYTRSGTSWAHQATLTQNNTSSEEGRSVSLSEDGNTLAAGSNYDNDNEQGAIEIYTRSGTTWTYQSAVSQNIPNSFEGNSVSLSADNSTLAAGATGINSDAGTTFVYSNN